MNQTASAAKRTIPASFTARTVTHLFAQAHLQTKPTLPRLKHTIEDPTQRCQFCSGSTELPWSRYTISKSYYGGNFTDYALIRTPTSHAICAACHLALKTGRRGWVLTPSSLKALKPSDPQWGHLLMTPLPPPFALILNSVKVKDGKLTADGAKPRHLLLSARLAWSQEEMPVSFGVHEVAWVRRADAIALYQGWNALLHDAIQSKIIPSSKQPQFLTAVAMMWLRHRPPTAAWPDTMQRRFRALPKTNQNAMLVLEYTIRRTILAEGGMEPSLNPQTRA
jgi:hypothetical protein